MSDAVSQPLPPAVKSGPASPLVPFQCTVAEMEAEMVSAYMAEAETWRSALQKIASADLKRCSAGWLKQIALEALEMKP